MVYAGSVDSLHPRRYSINCSRAAPVLMAIPRPPGSRSQYTCHCSVFWPARNAIISWLSPVVRLLVQLPCKHPRNNLCCSMGFNDEARPQSHSWSLGRTASIFVSQCDGNATELIHALLRRRSLFVVNRTRQAGHRYLIYEDSLIIFAYNYLGVGNFGKWPVTYR